MKKKSFWLILPIHLIYWQPTAINVFFNFSDQSGGGLDHDFIAKQSLVGASIGVVAFYIFYIALFPLIYKRPLKFVGYGLLVAVACFLVGTILLSSITTTETAKFGFPIGMSGIYLASRVLSSIAVACVLKGFVSWFTETRHNEQLEKKNLETNLALLKAQINPHFLFNTLNNIDVLIEKDPTTASVYLKKLSDILRFTLYESPAETVSLQLETEYIRQYIDLQKIRTANPDFVKFETEGDLSGLTIPPMLFIPFIENAFKHSTNKKIPNAIAIKISTRANGIDFVCSNAYDAETVTTQAGSGLGLELIKNRLQLLYQDNYRLDIDKTVDRFTVNLSITLK